MSFSIWLTLLSIISFRSINVVKSGKISSFFYGWVIYIFSIHSSTDRCSSWLHILAIVNNSTMNIGIYIALGGFHCCCSVTWIFFFLDKGLRMNNKKKKKRKPPVYGFLNYCFHIPWIKCPGVKLLDWMVVLFLIFETPPYCFP